LHFIRRIIFLSERKFLIEFLPEILTFLELFFQFNEINFIDENNLKNLKSKIFINLLLFSMIILKVDLN
jgi:hypothetical protein